MSSPQPELKPCEHYGVTRVSLQLLEGVENWACDGCGQTFRPTPPWNNRPEPPAEGPVYWAVRLSNGKPLPFTVRDTEDDALDAHEDEACVNPELVADQGYSTGQYRLVEVEPQEGAGGEG